MIHAGRVSTFWKLKSIHCPRTGVLNEDFEEWRRLMVGFLALTIFLNLTRVYLLKYPLLTDSHEVLVSKQNTE